ncbi:protein kinase-like domain, concanavalin A-like lectin/glucanase domain protein [Tanacetum coccineum]|uniref:Protein kinase-like domain, concanavalin A-like lectin/glucanase domain protein n=1 Tax=Tanacetum coccineum TaxID=301880 RepID=A0ABQ5B9F2_9ASTR
MSRRQYNQIMTYGLRSRQKPSNPNKISNFVGRIRGLKIFIGSFAYECDFMILEDTTSIIDHHLGEMVFGRPFIEETGLVYNKGEGTVMFEQNDEKITFKMPHTMEIFRQTKLMGLSTDSIPPFAHEENFGHGRTHYYQSLLIGNEYKQDGGDRRGIRHLIRSGAGRDEIFSQRYRFRSLERNQERATVTFSAIWRPILALEAWARHTNAYRAALWHAIYDIQREYHDLRRQIAEERHERLELKDRVARIERRQDS